MKLVYTKSSTKLPRTTLPDIQDACDFTVKFDETLLFDEYSEVAITEIMYGPLYNIEDYNNRFSLVRSRTKQDYNIPANFYETTTELMDAIKNQLDSMKMWSWSLVKQTPTFSYLKTGGCSLKINDDRTSFLVDNERNGSKNVLKYLGYSGDGSINTLYTAHKPLPTTTKIAKVVTNIVVESQIDNNMVGILDIVPLQCSVPGYSTLTIENPTYRSLIASQLNEISISITNMYGRKIDVQDIHYGATGYAYVKYPTIIKLHFRSSK